MTRLFSVILTMSFLLGGSSLADAALMTLKVDDLGIGGLDFLVEDNGVGDLDAGVGKIIHSGSTPNFSVIITTALSKPVLGGPP